MNTLSTSGQFAIYHEMIDFMSPADIAICYSTKKNIRTDLIWILIC